MSRRSYDRFRPVGGGVITGPFAERAFGARVLFGRRHEALEHKLGLGRATLLQRNDGVVGRRVLLDANVQSLQAFRREAGFVF